MTASRASRLSAQQSPRLVLGLGEQAADLLVDNLLCALGIGSFLAKWGTAQVRGLVRSVPDWSQQGRQSPFPDHLDGQLGGPGKVVGRSGGCLSYHQDLRGSAAQADGQGVE